MPPRFFKNDAELSRRDPRRQLEASLTRLVRDYPPDKIKPGGGLFKGPVSVAYALLALQSLYQDLQIEEKTLAEWTTEYLNYANGHMASYPGPEVGNCGMMDDILALLAIGAATTLDTEMAANLCDYSAEVIDPETENEFLYGRAGYLYLLRYVRNAFKIDQADPKTLRLIEDTQYDVIDAILDSPRPWKWHGKVYIGAMHGTIGTITQIVLTNPEKFAPKLEADLAVMLSYQYDNGNFPSSLPLERDKLVQFCHGAPGVVVSLLSIREFFPNLKDKIDKAIKRARECILERGLLTKEPCLCHGISGNALALDDKEFEHFLTYTTGNEMKAMERDKLLEKSSAPESLFGGEAGRAWTWAVADLGMNKRILGYNDL